MKVNLRRASVIQNGIRRAISEIDLGTVAEISVFSDDPVRAATEAHDKLVRDLALVDRLEAILYGIRAKVGEANTTAGVTAALAEDAALKERIGRYGRLVKADKAPTDNEIKAEIASKREAMAAQSAPSRYYTGVGGDTHISIVQEQDRLVWNEMLITAKRRRDEISEKLLMANMGTEIEIDDSDYSVLQKAGIV